MQIKVLFDKDALDENLRTGWGVSFLVDDKILFDTGEKGQWLTENMEALGVDVSGIEKAVISHEHWDHTGGLWEVLNRRKGLTVYGCPHFSSGFKKKVKAAQGNLVEIDKIREISKDIFTSGEMAGRFHGDYLPEQALFVKTEKGVTVITGCAHPGIEKILEKAKEKFPNEAMYLALGGFHLMRDDRRVIELVAERFRQIPVKKIGPAHCSGKVAENIFRNKYSDDFITLKVGLAIDI